MLQPAAAQNNLPALGDSDSAEFSVGAERKIGDEIMREIRVDPDYIDDPLLLEYLQSVWDPLVAAGAPARQHHRRHRPALLLAALPGARPERQRVRPARRLRRRAPRPDRHHRHPRRARLGARARAVARVAAAHRAQHHGQLEALAGQPGGADHRPARRLAQQQPGRDQRRRRRHPGGDHPGPAQLLARHGARGRPDRLPGDGRGRFRPRRHGLDVREDGRLDPAQRLRRLPLPAHPPADGRAHRRGALARQHVRRRARGSASSSTRWRSRARGC